MSNIFVKEVRMDTQTAFMTNGSIHIFPCAWEIEQAPITYGGRRAFRGRITVEEDGETRVVPYNSDGNPRYEELYSTEHCRLLMTQGGSIIEKWHFGSRMSIGEIAESRRREMRYINAWFRSRKREVMREEYRLRRLQSKQIGKGVKG